MTEMLDMDVGRGERKTAGEYANGTHGVPNTEEINVDVNGKGLFECSTLFPSFFVISGIHFVSERDLLIIRPRQ